MSIHTKFQEYRKKDTAELPHRIHAVRAAKFRKMVAHSFARLREGPATLTVRDEGKERSIRYGSFEQFYIEKILGWHFKASKEGLSLVASLSGNATSGDIFAKTRLGERFPVFFATNAQTPITQLPNIMHLDIPPFIIGQTRLCGITNNSVYNGVITMAQPLETVTVYYDAILNEAAQPGEMAPMLGSMLGELSDFAQEHFDPKKAVRGLIKKSNDLALPLQDPLRSRMVLLFSLLTKRELNLSLNGLHNRLLFSEISMALGKSVFSTKMITDAPQLVAMMNPVEKEGMRELFGLGSELAYGSTPYRTFVNYLDTAITNPNLAPPQTFAYRTIFLKFAQIANKILGQGQNPPTIRDAISHNPNYGALNAHIIKTEAQKMLDAISIRIFGSSWADIFDREALGKFKKEVISE